MKLTLDDAQKIIDQLNSQDCVAEWDRTYDSVKQLLTEVEIVSRFEAPVILQGELLPCPFCGSEAKFVQENEYVIECTKLGVCFGNIGEKSKGFTFKEDAIKYWNKRAGREPKSK